LVRPCTGAASRAAPLHVLDASSYTNTGFGRICAVVRTSRVRLL
jgi:hypothetical protein